MGGGWSSSGAVAGRSAAVPELLFYFIFENFIPKASSSSPLSYSHTDFFKKKQPQHLDLNFEVRKSQTKIHYLFSLKRRRALLLYVFFAQTQVPSSSPHRCGSDPLLLFRFWSEKRVVDDEQSRF